MALADRDAKEAPAERVAYKHALDTAFGQFLFQPSARGVGGDHGDELCCDHLDFLTGIPGS
jgi:hypothetical protein